MFDSYTMAACAHATNHTAPVDEQCNCNAVLGHDALDQLVAAHQAIDVNARITDHDHGKRGTGQVCNLFIKALRVYRATLHAIIFF